jgi:hypothetical protein
MVEQNDNKDKGGTVKHGMGKGVLAEITASAPVKARETANPFRKRRARAWYGSGNMGWRAWVRRAYAWHDSGVMGWRTEPYCY